MSDATLSARLAARRGRSRIWDEILGSRKPMKPERPHDLPDALLAHLLHPVRGMRRQLARGAGWSGAPWRLWSALACVAVGGSVLYGASLALAVPPAGAWHYSALALTAAAAAGWLLFAPVLAALTRQPPAHLAHACLVAMLFGEAVLEIGVLANLVMWLKGPAGVPGSMAINIGVVATANLGMLAVLAAQLRELRVRPALVAALWFAILNAAGLAAFRLFYPDLLPI